MTPARDPKQILVLGYRMSEKHLRGIWETSERHLKGIWKTLGSISETSERHLGGPGRHLGDWEASGRHLVAIIETIITDNHDRGTQLRPAIPPR